MTQGEQGVVRQATLRVSPHKIGKGLPSLNILPTAAQRFGSSEGGPLLRTGSSSPHCRTCLRCLQGWQETWLGWHGRWWSRTWQGLTTHHDYPQHTTQQHHPETPKPTRHMRTSTDCTRRETVHPLTSNNTHGEPRCEPNTPAVATHCPGTTVGALQYYEDYSITSRT